uniref:Ig-like domain-containing protein n=1 Tax=Odontella aurita TaxID=265563 RepID=A0A7S4MB85_9STRA|mmetsp:Transcript_16221/g.46751  ORF Transcript_16221/g.46751 Transcript_16221/m.46751 type:complete len:151 (+) Transcript_16221:70-522(+)
MSPHIIVRCFSFLLPLIHAAGAFQVSPSVPPDAVVRSQLLALQNDDMYTVFKFASPSNKAVTGPWQRFGEMVRTPPYAALVRHSRAEIMLTVSSSDDTAYRCLVQVWPDPNREPAMPAPPFVEYWWDLSRSFEKDSPYQGCYMVDGVRPI